MALGLPVAEMLQRISSRELAEWGAYSALEPWGETRDDLRAGIISATVANVNRAEGQQAMQPSQFMPDFETPSMAEYGETEEGEPIPDEPTDEELAVAEAHMQSQLALVEQLNVAFGGTDRRPKTT